MTPDTPQRYKAAPLDAEIAQHEPNMREGEARLPLEEQLGLKLRRFIESNISEPTVKVRVEKRRQEAFENL